MCPEPASLPESARVLFLAAAQHLAAKVNHTPWLIVWWCWAANFCCCTLLPEHHHRHCCRDTTSARQQVFLISQRRGPPQLLAMAQDLSKQFQVPLIAWGAVAADITPGSQQSGDSADNQVAPGRAFCFLPLPALTSLPVHINGFFELSSNRCARVACIMAPNNPSMPSSQLGEHLFCQLPGSSELFVPPGSACSKQL